MLKRNSRFLLVVFFIVAMSLVNSCSENKKEYFGIDVVKIDSLRIIKNAEKYLNIDPIPLTNFVCERSLGTKHDFYSEGDYWWPDTTNPDGPYIRRDGLTNPDNFVAHRVSMRNMSIQVATLTAAYKITLDKKYAEQAIKHLKTWFVNPDTKMNPNMNYAQAIKGVCAGRGVGLIDGIHLVEPAKCVSVFEQMNAIDETDVKIIKAWFAEFLSWMNTHEYGIDERERKNNHGSCWVMQAAEYAKLTGNKEMIEYSIDRFKNVILPNQLAKDGSFPLELARTKPYGYSLFNVDILSTVCQILSSKDKDLWSYELKDGQSMVMAMQYIYPFIKDKSKWPLKKDVMYWEQWPVRQPSLLFSGIALHNQEYLKLWSELPPEPNTEEGFRNFPIRQLILWVN